VTTEIRHAIRHLRSWMTPKRVSTPMFLVGTWSKILYEPKGVCLIISPGIFPSTSLLCRWYRQLQPETVSF
jgi:aldehyde dehydrogenase (NAD+)